MKQNQTIAGDLEKIILSYSKSLNSIEIAIIQLVTFSNFEQKI
jgi:hypothetical protein